MINLKKFFTRNKKQKQTNRDLKTIEELKKDEILFKKVLRIAQFESELDMGVNPASFEQANVGYLSERDFEYIKKVCVLVEKRLRDSSWLSQTLDNIENKYATKQHTAGGIRFDDELFKVGRGILESYQRELDND